MYKVPREAASVCAADIDMDGDNDIVVGHLFNSQTNWTGISILINNSLVPMELDSFFLNGQHRSVIIQFLDNNSFPDLISQSWDGTNSQIGIVFNLNTSMSNIYNVGTESYADDIETGDLNDDAATDIVFISNNNQYWSVLYNDGFGNFSSPEYHNLNYFPQNIVTGDLNNDGTDDIVIGGSTEIYFSRDGGFQNQQLGGYTSRVHIADMDNDGDNDIVGLFDLFGIETDITIFENKGEETFEEPVFVEIPNDGEAYRRATTADLDGNGFNDIVIVRRTGPNAATYNNVIILFNDGKGHFVDTNSVYVHQNEILLQQQINIYPNPSSGNITILSTNEKIKGIKIPDLNGRILLQEKFSPNQAKVSLNLSNSHLRSGMYLCSIKLENEIYVFKKLIVKTK